MEHQRGRSMRGLANDERILDATIAVVAAQGVDDFTLRDVAAKAGLTYGAMYARYSNHDELLADLWVRRCVQEFADLARLAHQAVREGGGADALVALLACTDGRLAAIECAVAAGRIDELADLVAPDVERLLLAHCTTPATPTAADGAPVRLDSVVVGLLCLALGVIATTPLGRPFALPPGLEAALRRADEVPGDARPQVEPRAPAELRFELPDNPLKEVLLNATARVVARSGVKGANLRRISRASGYSHTAVYTTYGSLSALLTDFVATVASRPTPADVVARRYSDVVTCLEWMRGWTLPEAHTRRRLVLEFLLGTIHDPQLGEMTMRADDQLELSVAAQMGKPGSRPYERMRQATRIMEALLYGASVLEETSGLLGGIDWYPLVVVLVGDDAR